MEHLATPCFEPNIPNFQAVALTSGDKFGIFIEWEYLGDNSQFWGTFCSKLVEHSVLGVTKSNFGSFRDFRVLSIC